MEKNTVVLDHTTLLGTSSTDGERIKRLSNRIDSMFRAMSQKRQAKTRMEKAKRVFNI